MGCKYRHFRKKLINKKQLYPVKKIKPLFLPPTIYCYEVFYPLRKICFPWSASVSNAILHYVSSI
jgi:hypothetical protein